MVCAVCGCEHCALGRQLTSSKRHRPRRGSGRLDPRRLSRRATRSADAAGRSQKLMAQSRPLVAGGTPAKCTCAEHDGAIRGVSSGVASACRSSGAMGEAWGGHLSTGLDVGRQRQNRPTTAALARLERSRRAGIITRAPEAFSMPLDSSIGARGRLPQRPSAGAAESPDLHPTARRGLVQLLKDENLARCATWRNH